MNSKLYPILEWMTKIEKFQAPDPRNPPDPPTPAYSSPHLQLQSALTTIVPCEIFFSFFSF